MYTEQKQDTFNLNAIMARLTFCAHRLESNSAHRQLQLRRLDKLRRAYHADPVEDMPRDVHSFSARVVTVHMV